MRRNHHRAFDPVFWVLLSVAAASTLLIAALMLSDRAPSWLRIIDSRVNAPDWLPFSDAEQLAHVGAWAVVTFLAVVALRTWTTRIVAAILIAFASYAVEAAQGVATASRSVQLGDLIDNSSGILWGFILAVPVAWLMEAYRHHDADG